MRTLPPALIASQKSMGDAKLELYLRKTGQASKFYYIDSGADRILQVRHTEQEWSQVTQVVIQDADATIAGLDLEGWLGYIGYGYGENYSDAAPMEVIAQRTVSMQGGIATALSLAGVFDFMDKEYASEDYTPEDTKGDTVKEILTAIAEVTMTCFSHCKAYTITFDSGYDDDIINSYMPGDYFSVSAGESRLSAFKKALAFTKCKARVEYDGEIHIFQPTISGSSYDYEYNDAVTGHNFFNKSVRKRLVIPNKITVRSHPDHTPQYTGSAVDSDSYAALGRYMEGAPRYIRAVSDAECTAIAEALMQNVQLDAERGHGFAPMNCGQEVFDYVKITDSRVGDTRVGNIGYLHREYSQGKFTMEFSFGKPAEGGIKGTDFIRAGTDKATLNDLNDAIANLMRWILERETVPKWHMTQRARIPTPDYILE